MSQQEAREEFIEGIERVNTDRASERLKKGRSMSLVFVQSLGVLLRMVVCYMCPHKHPRIS